MTNLMSEEIKELSIHREIKKYSKNKSARGYIDKTPQTGYCSVTSGDCTRSEDYDPPLVSKK